MNKTEALKQLVAAFRDPEIQKKQIPNALRDSKGNMCADGVMCDVYAKLTGNEALWDAACFNKKLWASDDVIEFFFGRKEKRGEEFVFTSDVLAVKDRELKVSLLFLGSQIEMPFAEIADLIEEQYDVGEEHAES